MWRTPCGRAAQLQPVLTPACYTASRTKLRTQKEQRERGVLVCLHMTIFLPNRLRHPALMMKAKRRASSSCSAGWARCWAVSCQNSPILSGVQTVLDVACGAGAWAIELACAFPHLRVIGIDHRPHLLNYNARALVLEQGLTNVTFSLGDLREEQQEGKQERQHPESTFPSPGTFDLVESGI